MARMRIEATAARAARHGVAARERAVAVLPRIAPFAARLPGLANAAQRAVAGRLGFARDRALPAWRGDVFRDAEAREGAGGGREVILFVDTFSRWFEPEIPRAALRVLRAAGLRPVTPPGAPLCCGRTYLAAGMIDRARAEARRTIEALAGAALAGAAPVVGLEPSCLLTLRDEVPSLVPGAASRALADRAFLLTEFLERESIALPLAPLAATARVHGHCHQKSFGAFPSALAALRRVPGLTVAPIASSCCGMAGAFGYQAESQAVSRAMAEAGLLPAVRAAADADLIVADGTSCRAQIAGLGGRAALHSVQVLASALTRPSSPACSSGASAPPPRPRTTP
jgi:Fe-S oxidoreductase